MNITNVKAMVAKMFTVGLLAGAVVIAAPNKAQAQIGIGVRIGSVYHQPVYEAPVYGYPQGDRGYYEARERAEWQRRQAYLQHEQEERFEEQRIARERYEHERYEQQQYRARAYYGHGDRDHDDHDEGRRNGR